MGALFSRYNNDVCKLNQEEQESITYINLFQSKTNNLQINNQILNNIKTLLSYFNINNVSINKLKTPKEIILYLHLDINDIINFHNKIGYRYCSHKSFQLEAIVSYKNLINKIIYQHNWIIDNLYKLINLIINKNLNVYNNNFSIKNLIIQITKQLQNIQPIIHPCVIPIIDLNINTLQFPNIKSIIDLNINNKLQFPNIKEYFLQIGVLDFFINKYFKKRDNNQFNHGIPTMNLKIIDIRNDNIYPVYDIQVDDTHSFLANGLVAHNCMIAHGTARFLKERLYDQSDPYTVFICNNCGNFATKNGCKPCNSSLVSKVNLPYVSKLVIQELNAMCIKCKITSTK